MTQRHTLAATSFLLMLLALGASAQSTAPARQTTPAGSDPVKRLVDRLDLERYKATVKGLTQFGDRREGTDRNRAAIDWIDNQTRATAAPTPSASSTTTSHAPPLRVHQTHLPRWPQASSDHKRPRRLAEADREGSAPARE